MSDTIRTEQSPAEGEVAELVEWLHDCANVRMDEGYEEPAFKFTRAAELLQQQEAELRECRKAFENFNQRRKADD